MNYTTSRDYEALWNLVQEGKEIVCWADYRYRDYSDESMQVKRGICATQKDIYHILVGTLAATVIHARSKLDFIGQCQAVNLEFLPPDEWIKIESDKDLPPNGDYCVMVYHELINDFDIARASYFYKSPSMGSKRYYQITEITHWKPMPEAPEAGE